jgi:S-adenosyl methyltransferase
VTSVYQQAPAQLHVRSLAGIQRFFDGFEMVEPGTVWINEWRPEPGVPGAGQPRSLRGGAGRKP